MYSDDEMIMISALQHYVFCKRQCALIHTEQVWSENYLTAAGRILHEHVDERGHETRHNIHTATAVRLVSHRLGLTGIADMLEFYQLDSKIDEHGIPVATAIPNLQKFWKPFPVEYKHGKPKAHRADEVQLCAQAICLEEMLHVTIANGALFYGKQRRRTSVFFDAELRNLTQTVSENVHQFLSSGETPISGYSKGCESCSLIDFCQPKIVNREKSVRCWLEKNIENTLT